MITSADTFGVAELREERLLRIGYFGILQCRYPFTVTENPERCSTPEEANLLAMEVRCMEVPQELAFPALQDSIDPVHKDRIFRVWRKLMTTRAYWEDITSDLKHKWTHAVPESKDSQAKEAISETRNLVRRELHKAIGAIISKPQRRGRGCSRLRQWQHEEKGLRRQFYDADKQYILLLRLYYELLLEKADAKSKEEPVLPLDHPERMNIVIMNRYLKVIDIVHQVIAIAKAAHHNQEGKRLRKTEILPFVSHPLRVMMAYLLDVIPYVIEKKDVEHDCVLGCTVMGLHDIEEDTELTLEGIEEFLRSRADNYDSSIDPVIQSGFGVSRENLKRRNLDLVKDNVIDRFGGVLKIMSKNAPLTDGEKKRGLELNALGYPRTMEVLELGENRYEQWGIDKENLQSPLTCIQQFPGSNEPQERDLDAFLVRLSMFQQKPVRQLALIAKLEDRADNNNTLKGRKPETQRGNLRSTVTKLIAYAMLDHDNERYPLYNALPRLIDVTLNEYHRFGGEHFEMMEERDYGYITQLQVWQTAN
ncbi:MAG: hypothetical protein AAB606_03975 [Patescibacteria group bacterium]